MYSMKEALLKSIKELHDAVTYIDWKQNFYDDVLSGKTRYYSNLIPELKEQLTLTASRPTPLADISYPIHCRL